MASSPTVDAFLWEVNPGPVPSRLELSPELQPDRVFRPRIAAADFPLQDVIDIEPVRAYEPIVPAGMFNQWPLEVLLHNDKPFTGMVVLIDVVTHVRQSVADEGLLRSMTACVAGLLRENDFGCRTTGDEFVVVYGGLEGAEAQRRLSYVSEQLWQHQQRCQGVFSLLFSWGGIGKCGKPLSEAMSSAVRRMNQINRRRNVISMGSVKQHRKTV
jgi:hypothetical protein